MQGIILNSEQDFNQLNTQIHEWAKLNIPKYKATKWVEPKIGQDGKYLLIIDQFRLSGFDFAGYTISQIDTDMDTNFFPNVE